MTRRTYEFYLCVGDFGGSTGDGHQTTEKFLIKSTHSLQQIINAHQLASHGWAIDLGLECNDMEINTLSEKFKKDYMAIFDLKPSEMPETVSPYFFVEMYIRIASLYQKDLDCVIVTLPNHYIGGYGLV